MKNKSNQASPVGSDVLQSETDVLHAVKRANSLSKASSQNEAGQPANIKRDNSVENTKKAAAASQQEEANRQPAEKSELASPTEKKPAEDSPAVPLFNLAGQILAEQRRFASERRRKANPTEATGGSYAADDTVGDVIRKVKDNLARPVEAAAGPKDATCAVYGAPVDAVDMNDAQKLLITDIVTRDIAALCGRRHHDSL